MLTEMDAIRHRLNKLERQRDEEILALVEILSNSTFFGQLKQMNCEYARHGQCSFFVLDDEAKNKIPIISQCRIEDCAFPYEHFHIELSNIGCTLCVASRIEKHLVDPNQKKSNKVVKLSHRNRNRTPER